MPPSFSASGDGFTAIPNAILDPLLWLPVSKRDLKVLLLVIRLTYGCHKPWVALRPADLAAVGIGLNHAAECFTSLLERHLLKKEGRGYQINSDYMLTYLPAESAPCLERLNLLIGQQLGALYYFGKGSPKRVPQPYPPAESLPSAKGNVSALSGWSFSRSRRRFEKDFPAS